MSIRWPIVGLDAATASQRPSVRRWRDEIREPKGSVGIGRCAGAKALDDQSRQPERYAAGLDLKDRRRRNPPFGGPRRPQRVPLGT